MKTALRAILAVATGMGLACVLVVAIELFRSVVHPLPPGFTGAIEEMCGHVARYSDWVLGTVVVLWSAAAFLSKPSRPTSLQSIGLYTKRQMCY